MSVFLFLQPYSYVKFNQYFNVSYFLFFSCKLVDCVVGGGWIWEHHQVPGGTIIYTQLGAKELQDEDGFNIPLRIGHKT